MFNAMKYIKKLEEAGFQREQAEAQVQMVFETIDNEMATKSDLAQLKTHLEHRFTEFEYRIVTKLSALALTLSTISVALITWLVKAA